MSTDQEYQGFLRGVGGAIREFRKLRGLSQAELGSLAGHRTQSAIGRLEREPAPNTSLRLLFEIAQVLNVPVADLLIRAQRISQESVDKEPEIGELLTAIDSMPEEKKIRTKKLVQEIINLQ